MEAKVIFKNGTEITAEKNGDCLIVNTKPEFPNDLSTVVVQSGNETKTYNHAIVLDCASIDNRYWFAFKEISEEERTNKQMQAYIEYIAMMSDIDLEEV